MTQNTRRGISPKPRPASLRFARFWTGSALTLVALTLVALTLVALTLVAWASSAQASEAGLSAGERALIERLRARYPMAPRTAPSPHSREPVRFAAWGDSGTGDATQRRVAARIEAWRPDFLVHTGDLVYPRGAPADYEARFFAPYASLLRRAPFYGALGNHDVQHGGGRFFLALFAFPANGPRGVQAGRNYYFRRGAAAFWVLDSNASARVMQGSIAPWLDQTLASSQAPWKIAVIHAPPFSSGHHGGYALVARVLAPILQKRGVDLVLSGHDHGFERFAPRERTTYVVTGAGGYKLYPRRRFDPATATYNNTRHGFTAIEIRDGSLQGRQIGDDGSSLDSWTQVKP